jgi:hypothetical protein
LKLNQDVLAVHLQLRLDDLPVLPGLGRPARLAVEDNARACVDYFFCQFRAVHSDPLPAPGGVGLLARVRTAAPRVLDRCGGGDGRAASAKPNPFSFLPPPPFHPLLTRNAPFCYTLSFCVGRSHFSCVGRSPLPFRVSLRSGITILSPALCL